MDSVVKSLRSLTKGVGGDKATLYAAYALFATAALYIFYCGQITTIGLAIGVAIILFVVSGNLAASLVGGALAGLIAVSRRGGKEGFEDHSRTSDDDEEPFEEAEKPKPKEGFSRQGGKKLPDNGERGEFFELGKKYKGPKEEDDGDYHLDAGTTFMNAYKSLKPEQIAAMTKDTQELMATQKQLMNTLSTLKPLIQDGKQMMDMFQGYFGSGGMPALGAAGGTN
jgi:hypothetical protein